MSRRQKLLVTIGMSAIGVAVTLAAQAPAVTYRSHSEIASVLREKAKATPAPVMVSAPVSAGDHYQINVVHRTKPQGAIAHAVGSEIHSIIDGSATLVTGGTIVWLSAHSPADRCPAARSRKRREPHGQTRVMSCSCLPRHATLVSEYRRGRHLPRDPLRCRGRAGQPPRQCPIAASAVRTILAEKAAAVPGAADVLRRRWRGARSFRPTSSSGRSRRAAGAPRARHRGPPDSRRCGDAGDRRHGDPAAGGRRWHVDDSKAATARKVAAGDVVLIPPNTPHW